MRFAFIYILDMSLRCVCLCSLKDARQKAAKQALMNGATKLKTMATCLNIMHCCYRILGAYVRTEEMTLNEKSNMRMRTAPVAASSRVEYAGWKTESLAASKAETRPVATAQRAPTGPAPARIHSSSMRAVQW